jgi:hypothetical protein
VGLKGPRYSWSVSMPSKFGAVATLAIALISLVVSERRAAAQQHDHAHMNMAANQGWQFMYDGVVWAVFNDQSGPRGGTEFVAPNWWMLMANRHTTHGTFTLSWMSSLDPATVGGAGSRELFQAGEVFQGQPIVDHQHPHDFFMQAAASWQIALTASTHLTLTGAPVGGPALGPVPYMHRASSFDNPVTPLTHHLFDSTHVSFGVATAAIEHGPWALEGSVFNGREPDEHRWDVDFGPMDSASGRLWFKPNAEWAFQVSTGHLVAPEQLEPGNIQRTTVSASWTRLSGANVESVTAGYGRNGTTFDLSRNGAFLEGARHAGPNTLFGRVEVLQLDHAIADVTIGAFTVGGVRDILSRRGFVGGIGADLTLYATPALLTPSYGARPVSWQVFFRLRPSEHGSEHLVNMQ